MRSSRSAISVGLLSVLVLSCTQAPSPITCETATRIPTTPVVMVPGYTGSVLEDVEEGKVVWGTGGALLGPFSRGCRLALPLALSGVDRARLQPTSVIMDIRLGPFRKEIYRPLARQMRACGFRVGDLRRPRPTDTFLFFPYDWRQDNTITAADLVAQLEALRQVRGEERLRVNLVCQSAAVHLCRWAVKYGAATIDEAQSGEGGLPSDIEIHRIVLVGPSSGGSLRNLRWLDRGRRYVGLIGRRFSPEVLFTFPSLYQDLPCSSRDLFLDADGKALTADLFDPQTWQDYGWSVFRDPIRRRLGGRGRRQLFGDAAQRRGHLDQVLDRSRRFHDLLGRDVAGFGSTSYHVVQNVHQETPRRAVLVQRGQQWRTLFTGDRWLETRPELAELASALGDGHATRESQLRLAPQERAAIAGAPLELRDGHFEMINNPATWRLLARLFTTSEQRSQREHDGDAAESDGRADHGDDQGRAHAHPAGDACPGPARGWRRTS